MLTTLVDQNPWHESNPAIGTPQGLGKTIQSIAFIAALQ